MSSLQVLGRAERLVAQLNSLKSITRILKLSLSNLKNVRYFQGGIQVCIESKAYLEGLSQKLPIVA